MHRFNDYTTRTWAEIDLDALQHNFMQIKSLMNPNTKIMAVVKANAYGHGAILCARTLIDAGADYLAVASVEEALELREAGIKTPILILGYIPPSAAETVIANNITATVYSTDFANALSQAAVRLQKNCTIHLKINSGMERIGFEPDETEKMISACRLPGLFTEGIFTHLACADEEDSSSVHAQYCLFEKTFTALQNAGIVLPLKHILNSAGIFDFPEYQLDMVRPGIVLYGYYPSHYIHTERAELRPVMALKSRISHLHALQAGSAVSYGHTYTATTDRLIATIPIGYADGLPRLLSSRGKMLVDGIAAPIVGRICMDQCMIDVTSVNTTSVGDEITIIGKQGDEEITADVLAKLTNTISYEILCDIGKRVPRLYKKDGNFNFVLSGFYGLRQLEEITP